MYGRKIEGWWRRLWERVGVAKHWERVMKLQWGDPRELFIAFYDDGENRS